MLFLIFIVMQNNLNWNMSNNIFKMFSHFKNRSEISVFPFQVSTSVCVSWESASRHHAAAWRSAPRWVCPTVASQLVRPRTLMLIVRLWCHQSVPCDSGAAGVWVNHPGGVPACPAAPTQCWPLPTPSMRTSQTATMVGRDANLFY